MENNANYKSGFVALIGRPNVDRTEDCDYIQETADHPQPHPDRLYV